MTPDSEIYVSETKGPQDVKEMQFNHLVNTKKKLLRQWAAFNVQHIKAVALAPCPNSMVDTPTSLAEFADPSSLYPVYDTICIEIEARSEANALKKAVREASKSTVSLT